MKRINKGLLLRYIITNVIISSSLVLILWYTGRFIEGVLDDIGIVLYAPSFLILSLIQGMNETMHFTAYRSFLIVSFIFYSAVIAMVQIFIYKRRRKKQDKLDQ